MCAGGVGLQAAGGMSPACFSCRSTTSPAQSSPEVAPPCQSLTPFACLPRLRSVVCWLCGLDPLGGASLSLATARAAAIGGAAAAPLVALKLLLWSEQARRQWDFLDDIHRVQVGAGGGAGWVLAGERVHMQGNCGCLPGGARRHAFAAVALFSCLRPGSVLRGWRLMSCAALPAGRWRLSSR